jgi:hypothetical protein
LAEVGFAIHSITSSTEPRYLGVYVAPDVNNQLKARDPEQANASLRARQLVLAHLKKVSHPRVFVVSSLQELLDYTLQAHASLV